MARVEALFWGLVQARFDVLCSPQGIAQTCSDALYSQWCVEPGFEAWYSQHGSFVIVPFTDEPVNDLHRWHVLGPEAAPVLALHPTI